MVCSQDWEIRHPQELIRPIQDQNKLPWTRPEPTDAFTTVNESSVSVTSGSNSVVITDSTITTTSQILITGMSPVDPNAIIDRVTVGSGTATVTFKPSPLNDFTLYFRII